MYRTILCLLLLGFSFYPINVQAAGSSAAEESKWNTVNNELLNLSEQAEQLLKALKDNTDTYHLQQTELERSVAKLQSLEINLQTIDEKLKKEMEQSEQIGEKGSGTRYFTYLFHSSDANFIKRIGTGFSEVKKQNALHDTYLNQKQQSKNIKKQIKQLKKKNESLRVEMEGNLQVITEQKAVKTYLLSDLAKKKKEVQEMSMKKTLDTNYDVASFVSPAKGEIISTYGYRIDGMKNGITIQNKSKKSVPVLSVAKGMVTRSYFSNTLGNVIHIEHNLENIVYETIYTHLNLRTSQVNDSVEKGTLIGIMGDTGNVSGGKQLIFEMKTIDAATGEETSVNPLLYFSISK